MIKLKKTREDLKTQLYMIFQKPLLSVICGVIGTLVSITYFKNLFQIDLPTGLNSYLPYYLIVIPMGVLFGVAVLIIILIIKTVFATIRNLFYDDEDNESE